MFLPFTTEVWLTLAALAVGFSILFNLTSSRWRKTVEEISPADITYHTVMQPCGKDIINVDNAKIKGLSFGWIVFCIIMMEFWIAGLTALLVREGTYDYPITWTEMQNAAGSKTLCLVGGAANDVYFTNILSELEYSYNIIRKNTIGEQIDAVVSGECDSADITLEDYNMAPRFKQNGNCPAVLSGNDAIANRKRGFMSRRSASCIMTAMSSLIHVYSADTCTIRSSNPSKCNLLQLRTHYFPATTCSKESRDGTSEIALDLEDVSAPLVLLGVLTVLGSILTFLGRRNEHIPTCLVQSFNHSSEAREVRNYQKRKLTNEYKLANERRKPKDFDSVCNERSIANKQPMADPYVY